MKFLEPNPQASQLLFAWHGLVIGWLWLSQDPEVRVPSLAGLRVLHEAKEEAVGALRESSQCGDRL